MEAFWCMGKACLEYTKKWGQAGRHQQVGRGSAPNKVRTGEDTYPYLIFNQRFSGFTNVLFKLKLMLGVLGMVMNIKSIALIG